MGQLWGKFAPRLPHIMMPLSNRAIDLGIAAAPAPGGSVKGSQRVPGGHSRFVMPTPPARHRWTHASAIRLNTGAVVHGKVVRNDDVPPTADTGTVRVRPVARLDLRHLS